MKKFLTVIGIAAICHGLNKALCESQGDTSQPSWDDAPDWQKESAVNGVKFHLANPDALPSASHENWMKQKLEEGWKYGQVKDAEKKEHPCIVPYEELPNSQKSKDYIFKQAVHELAPYLSSESAGKEDVERGDGHTAPDFETKLAKGDVVMVATGGPKMKVDAVFNTPQGVKAHCSWNVGKSPTSDVFFERHLHKFPAAEEAAKEEVADVNGSTEGEASQEGEAPTSDAKA